MKKTKTKCLCKACKKCKFWVAFLPDGARFCDADIFSQEDHEYAKKIGCEVEIIRSGVRI